MEHMKRVNTTMPESLLKSVDLYSELNLEDRSTAIRQLVAAGLRVKLRETVLDHYARGKITIRQGAELLGVTYWEMDDLLRSNRVPLMSDLSIALERPSKKKGRHAKPASRRAG